MKDRSRDHDIEAYTRFVEDYARALDESGWMIVPQPDMAKYGPWLMDSKFGPVPWWAKDTDEHRRKADTAKAVTAGDRRRQAMSGGSGESVKSVKSVILHASKNRFSLARAYFTILDQLLRFILRVENHGHHGHHGLTDRPR